MVITFVAEHSETNNLNNHSQCLHIHVYIRFGPKGGSVWGVGGGGGRGYKAQNTTGKYNS